MDAFKTIMLYIGVISIIILISLLVTIDHQTNIIDLDNCTITIHDNNNIVTDRKYIGNIRIRKRNYGINNNKLSINVISVKELNSK